MNQATKEVFDRIDGVATGTAFAAAALSRQLGIALIPVLERSDDYTLIYAGAGMPGLVSDAELRLPGPAATNRSQLLQLSLNPAQCVTMQEARNRYGDGELSVPTPRQPPDAPLYLVYARDWGKLSLGFSRQGEQCLRRVVVDLQRAS